MNVRVRFAPSPTGYLHIGGARTALYNWLFARRHEGKFVLRIEDTDQKRNTEESSRTILEGLTWLGLGWDEGPYYQSQRLDLYRREADRLKASGRAYEREDPGKGKALVFKIDRARIDWGDLVHGPSSRDVSADPDLVIVKSDGYPTYNFACVVDDHEMGITHVLRADEHYPNTPKQISLYRALGWPPPVFGHMPLIFDPKGEKISKRKTYDFPVTVEDARAMGYLPEALVNFLALLGWSPGNNVELMTRQEMIASFTAERIGTTPAKFLQDKLLWMNKQYIKKLPPDELLGRVRGFWQAAYDLSKQPPEKLKSLALLQADRMEKLTDIVPLTKFAMSPSVEYETGPVAKVLRKEGTAAVLSEAKKCLRQIADYRAASLEEELRKLAVRLGVKFQEVAQPLRVAVTGSDRSPPIHDTLEAVGREASLARIDRALEIIQKGV